MDLNPKYPYRKCLASPLLLVLFVSLSEVPFCQAFQTDSGSHVETLSVRIAPLLHDPKALSRREFQTLGASSCSASACHGGPAAGVSDPLSPRGSEYPLWIEGDPHARSWRTLNSRQSIEILERLSILIDGKIANQAAYQNCLACHNSSVELLSDGISPAFPEGVGCEACHGPSERWKNSHYQGPTSVRSAILDRGLVDTKSELVRAKACTLCHVGGPDRDMNHDIIAAGHPALYFDYSTYLKAYPKHWRDRPSDTHLEGPRRWLISQIAQADSEMELLLKRSNSADSNTTWPEFSNFQCTSCHQMLSDSMENFAIESRGLPGLPSLGKASVRLWNLDGLAAVDTALKLDTAVTKDLLMAIQNAAWSNPAETAQEPLRSLLGRKRHELYQGLAYLDTAEDGQSQWPWTEDDQRSWAKTKWISANENYNWEQAALAYLATMATDANSTRSDALVRVRLQLLFPETTQSPMVPVRKREANLQKVAPRGLQLDSWSRNITEILESLHP